MKRWSGTARRLVISFLLLIAFFAVATYYSLEGLVDIHHKLHRLGDDYSTIAAGLGLEAIAWQRYALELERRAGIPASPVVDGKEAAWAHELIGELRMHGGPARAATADAVERDLALLASSPTPQATGHDDDLLRRMAAAAVDARLRSRELVRLVAPSVSDFETHPGVIQHVGFRHALVFLAVAMLLLLAVGTYIQRSIARPLKALGEATEHFSTGNLDVLVRVEGADEFGRLAEQLNAMAAALKDKQERLVQSERLAGIGRLAAGVAHEINNPLGVILGYVRMLEHKAAPGMVEDLHIIADETVRCQEIVEGLVDLSRPLKVDGAQVALRAVCEEVAARIEQTMLLSGVRIAIAGEAVVVGSVARLRQVMLNIVKNAVEAGGASGRVSIRIGPSTDGQFIVVDVEDAGPGLSPEVRERIFEPFVTTKPSGTGLGLAVSQGIAQAHGGRIQIADALGSGAIVSLWLPRPGVAR